MNFHILLATTVLVAGTCQLALAQTSEIPPPGGVYYEGVGQSATPGASSAYPEGDYYQQLSAAGGQGGGCGVGCGDQWGCGGSPFRTGPGCDDDWEVGPRWRVVLDGVMMYREKTDLAPLAAAMGTTLADAEQFNNFDHGAGARLLATAYWPQCKNYELTIGYLGTEEWNANIVLPVTNIPPVVGPPASVAVDQRRTLNYNSSLHTLELNWQALNDTVWKPYAGIRYFSFDEVISDRTRQYASAPLVVGDQAITTNLLDATDVKNNLIGFQLGIRRDLWKVSRKIYFQGFANAGLYCNLIDRSDIDRTTTTTTEVLDDDPATTDVDETGQVQTITARTGNRVDTERADVAFAGEMSLALVWKINNCCALRSGYQVLAINGVELADDAFLGDPESRNLVFHGAFAGFEYRR